MAIEPYMRDCYQKEFKARVKTAKDGKFVALDQTYFYPASGGQPFDTGTLKTSDGRKVNVVYVGKFGGHISHQVEPEGVLKEGDEVHAVIDWDRRYKHMRMHTAAHLVSYVFEHEKGAVVTGNQIAEDKTRIDYQLDDYDPEEMRSYQEKVNDLIAQDLPIKSLFLSREEAEKKVARMTTLAAGFPDDVKEVRLLQIGDIDIQACGGTHLKSTGEVGRVKFLKFDNKGKNNRRVYYALEP
jgi:misacylated tRNA(Ala) deacylase